MPALLIALVLSLARAEPSPAAKEEARRIAFSLEIAAAEYQKAVTGHDGIDKVEQQEAVDFLAQARERFARLAARERLDDFTREPVAAQLAALEAEARAAKGDPGAFRGRAARAGADLAAAFGASVRLVPPRRPSARAGAEVYRMHCAMCHGAKGDGQGPARPGLAPKPADFVEADDMRRIPPVEFFRVAAVGVDGTAMTAFDDRLSDAQRWDAVNHLYSFTLAAAAAKGRERLAGRRARLPAELKDEAVLAESSQEALEKRLAAAFPEDTPAERAELAAALRLDEPPGGPPSEGGSGPDFGPAVSAVKAELARAVSLAASGDGPGAGNAAADAYLRFETVEPAARALHPGRTADLEAAFSELRSAALAASPEVPAKAADLERLLDELAAPRAALGSAGTFAQSVLIIGREGFEAMLILAAIAALLVRAGRAAMLRTFYAGAWAAVGASLATAWLLEAVFRLTPVEQEALEGLVMLAAAATLVWVASWMLDAAAMGDWNRWLRERLGKAGADGRGGVALASVSFLAVYREGFETVLFYKALWAMDPGQTPAIAAGFSAGCAGLGVLFVLMRRGTLKLPMRPFFLGTGLLLFVLALTFAGQAPAEFQAAGWLRSTPTPWTWALPWAGMNPTWESFLPQAGLLALGGAAALRLRRRAKAESV